MLDKLADNEIRNLIEEKNLENSQAELFGIDFSNAGACEDVQAAESFWVSSAAIKNLLHLYLRAIFDREINFTAGRSSQKVRFKAEEKARMLVELRKSQKNRNYQRRAWERWLKGASEDCELTFEQDVAAENRETQFLNISHPLVSQAAAFFAAKQLAPLAIKVCDQSCPSGTYYFAVYLWELKGIKKEIRLQVVASDDSIKDNLLSYLESAVQFEPETFDHDRVDFLEKQHHAEWSAACVDFREQMQKLAQTRLQSLIASTNAEARSVKAALALSSEPNFQRMKKKQLENIETAFKERCREIEEKAETSDILTQRILTGLVQVEA